MTELLSPAGDFKTALAAFDAGADAVYCGLGDFSARAFAVNFSAEDLKNLVRVARARGRKVYVTFNTLIDEADLESAVARLADLADIGPDALIVQDLGVARLVRRHFPELVLHASTQLVAHNLEGVLALKELGFARVVLARELSLAEIASIAQRCGGLELECFIHGALCYSISGLCLFGAMEKGRSGNRGKCPYCCRLGYDVDANKSSRQQDEESRRAPVDAVSHHVPVDAEPRRVPVDAVAHRVLPFSMKDLRLGEDVRKLVDAGVASLKIEGRMKSALYVASVTKYYRQILDGEARTARDSRAELEVCAREVTSTTGTDRTARDSRADRRKVTVADLETVFSRRTTELYFNGAPVSASATSGSEPSASSPIDPTSLGHLGTPIGTVKRVTKDREGRSWLRFHTARALERHDGLQFASPVQGEKPFGFGISEMRTAFSRSNVFEVAAGTDVEVLLPDDAASRRGSVDAVAHRVNTDGSRSSSDAESLRVYGDAVRTPRLQGATVYCSMSNAVKRMFPEPSFRPSDYPGDKVLDVAVTLTPDKITAEASVSGPAREGTRRTGGCRTCGPDGKIQAVVAGSFSPAKDPSRTYGAVEKALSKLGGTDYRLGKLVLNDPDRLFAPASLLNDLRRDLVERVDAARAAARQARIEEALVPVDAVAHRVKEGRHSIRLRAGQGVPAGEWDEIVIAIDRTTEPDDLSSFVSRIANSESCIGADAPATQASLRLALPVYTKEPDFNRLRTLVKRFLRAGFSKWEASDLATVRMLKSLGVADLTADWTLYAFNSQALAALAELGVTRFVASPENNSDNLAYLSESGYPVALLVQQSTPLFISLTKPASCACGDLAIYERDGLWITTKRRPRVFDAPKDAATRVDLSWDPPLQNVENPS